MGSGGCDQVEWKPPDGSDPGVSPCPRIRSAKRMDGIRVHIPPQTGHPFRLNSARDSDPNRPPVPTYAGQGFRRMPATLSRANRPPDWGHLAVASARLASSHRDSLPCPETVRSYPYRKAGIGSMAQRRLSMRKIQEVLRQKALGRSNRQIASDCSLARSTVADYLGRAEAAGLS